MVEAQVLDYNRMVCRTPPSKTKDFVSVPFSISFGEDDNKPWTLDLHRFRYYKQPRLGYATPEIVDVRRKTEIYVYPEDGYTFE